MTGVEIALIAGAAMSAVGAISSGNAARKSGDYNAAVNEANAVGARNAAAENAKRVERQGRQRMGELRNSGLLVSMDVLEDQAREEELAVLTATYEGELDALGLERGATLSRMEGRNAQKAGYINAAGSLLQGGATAYGSGAFSGSKPYYGSSSMTKLPHGSAL
jgi:hypothetical protein